MNVRIDAHSVRIRLLIADVVRLGSVGSLEVRLEFAPGFPAFACRVEAAELPEPVAVYRDGFLIMQLPAQFVAEWAGNDIVGAKALCEDVVVTVEKDLRRIKPWSADAKETQRFPNPRVGNSWSA